MAYYLQRQPLDYRIGIPYVVPPTKESLERLKNRLHWRKMAQLWKSKYQADPELIARKLDKEYVAVIRG